MKTTVHRASDRGFASHGWLQASHSFSFANYYNPEKMGFGTLRVLNDDTIASKMGFGTHPHDNMEIITIPLSGCLKHKDSMNGKWQTLITDEVQVMSAGSGLQHSEINGSETELLNLFQIWILPNKRNVEPRYEQKVFDSVDRKDELQTMVTSFENGVEGSLKIHQDARIHRLDLSAEASFEYALKSKNHGVSVMTIHGNITICGEELQQRDAIGISQTDSFTITSNEASELLLIEIPMQ